MVSLILIDVSNTFSKFVFSSPKKFEGKIYYLETSKITAAYLRKLSASQPTLDRAILSCVVPSKLNIFKKIFGKKLFEVRGHKKIGVPIDYPNPKEIGADRLANAIAARVHYGFPSLVIDFGTATTFDVINKKGYYCGGVIAPGLNYMLQYLHKNTALLPLVKLSEPQKMIGKSTSEAIRIGILIGYRGLIREVIQKTCSELKISPEKIKIIATGGQASLITKKIPEISVVDNSLTLKGLLCIAQYLFP